MPRIMTLGLIAAALAWPALAQDVVANEIQDVSAEEEDTIVRLPASGEVRSERDRKRLQADRLKAGGGLLASFDSDENGRIDSAELQSGIEAAFEAADANGDSELTALEQQAWARNLPTRDNSLANPVRFDPNLDSRVSFAEFSAVITNLWSDYIDDGDKELRVASLKAPKEERQRNRFGLPEEYRGALPGEVTESDASLMR